MPGKINHIDAYILAGGKSTRMGTDKGLLFFKGKPLIENIMDQLRPVFKRIIIVSNNSEYKKFGVKVIEDLIQGIGPAGGIHAALSDAESSVVFIISCDMPFVTSDAIAHIIQQSAGSQIALPLFHGKVQPLLGVYAKSCLAKWKELIDRKIIKLQEMVAQFEFLKINVDNQALFNETLFMNVNDKNDYIKAVQQQRHGN